MLHSPQVRTKTENTVLKVGQPDETNPMNTFKDHHLYGQPFNPLNHTVKPRVAQTDRTMFRNTGNSVLR